MAGNYVQPGKILTLTAPYNRTTGQGALVGSIFGVALQTVLINVEGEFQVDGVWTLAKTSAQAWAVGDKIYWDDNNKRCDSDSTQGKLIGVATAIAANPSSTGNVRLNGSAGATAEGIGLDTTELGLLNGATAGSITASKVVTRTAAQGIPRATAVVAAIGADASDGAALTKDINLVTGADNTTCVVLPVGVAGETIVVVNTVANKVLPVFPAGTENINGAGAGVVFTMGPARAVAFVCTAAGVWYAEKLAAATPNATELALLTGAGTGGTPVASKVQVADVNQNIGAVKATSLAIGATGAEVAVTATPAELNALAGAGISAAEAVQLGLITATAAQIDAAVAGTPLVYRTNVTTAQVNAGVTAVVPAVAGKRFQVLSIAMRSNGNVGTATTVGVQEDGGAIFLSHVQADLTNGVWHNLVTGTPVVTGMTSGGMTAVANKALLAYCAGGVLDTATSIDYIVVGYYTTT